MVWTRRKPPGWAAIFADDLIEGCRDLVSAFGLDQLARGLPISIPIDEDGGVLLQPAGPLAAPRVAAVMAVTRAMNDGYAIRIERRDAGRLLIPGLLGGPLGAITFVVNPAGMTICGVGEDHIPVTLSFDEDTARALATALLITIGMKLTKAGRPDPG